MLLIIIFTMKGDPVRIFVFRNSCLCRNFFPALFSFKKVYALIFTVFTIHIATITILIPIVFRFCFLWCFSCPSSAQPSP